MADCICGHRQATRERSNGRGNCPEPQTTKPPARDAYAYDIVVFFLVAGANSQQCRKSALLACRKPKRTKFGVLPPARRSAAQLSIPPPQCDARSRLWPSNCTSQPHSCPEKWAANVSFGGPLHGGTPPPAGAYSRAEHRTKPVLPVAHRFVADLATPLKQKIFDVTQRQRKPNVKHHRQADHL